jgi:hypothetical protein
VWRRFFAAHAVSVTGTALTTVVLPLALYQRTGSAGLTALLTALQTVAGCPRFHPTVGRLLAGIDGV